MTDLPAGRAVVWRKALIIGSQLAKNTDLDTRRVQHERQMEWSRTVEYLLDESPEVQDLGARHVEQLWAGLSRKML